MMRITSLYTHAMAKTAAMQVIPFRLPADLVKRLDRHAARLGKEQPGLRATRSDALRVLLNAALDQAEKRHGKA